ncbi:MAG: hypothetical protein KAR42_01930 [candidate division Zixibacteria bacterium]|nr:hypothetical protein [candidate division Zixibacteria bacterium]
MTFKGNNLWGLILVVAGVLFLLNNFHIDIFGMVSIWPIALIAFGGYLVIRALKKDSGQKSSFSDFTVFGDTNRDSIDNEIDGTNISHFIGDTELNITRGELKIGENKINLSSFIGDARVFVPRDAAVKLNVSSLFGDIHFFDIKRSGVGSSFTEKTANYDSSEKKIFINASSFIGDIKIQGMG